MAMEAMQTPAAQSNADWKVTYDPSCTLAQVTAGDAAMAAFDLNGWIEAP
jgi:hypothetical protein